MLTSNWNGNDNAEGRIILNVSIPKNAEPVSPVTVTVLSYVDDIRRKYASGRWPVLAT